MNGFFVLKKKNACALVEEEEREKREREREKD